MMLYVMLSDDVSEGAVYMVKYIGPRTEPWGTPQDI